MFGFYISIVYKKIYYIMFNKINNMSWPDLTVIKDHTISDSRILNNSINPLDNDTCLHGYC